jgi:DNA-binding NarL/FixJ family response regulator
MIRVFVADDQALVRQGIRALLTLDPEMTIVGEASDGREAVARISQNEADVVLLDIRMPHRSGLEVLRELAARNDLPPTIVLTTFEDATVLLEAMRIGARGFLLKDISFEQLVRAIRSVASGSTVFHPALTQRLIESRAHLAPFDSLEQPDPLTEREIEVVRLMAAGYSNREIAQALGTAEGTIKNHVSNVLSKFGVRDRTRAVLKALESGVL